MNYSSFLINFVLLLEDYKKYKENQKNIAWSFLSFLRSFLLLDFFFLYFYFGILFFVKL